MFYVLPLLNFVKNGKNQILMIYSSTFQYLKTIFVISIILSVSLLNELNGKAGVMVSAYPNPGHSQLEFYKRQQYQKYAVEEARNRGGRRLGQEPWAAGYRNNAESANGKSPFVVVMILTAMQLING